MKYQEYKAEDFLNDQEFVNWVSNSDSENMEFSKIQTNGNPYIWWTVRRIVIFILIDYEVVSEKEG